MGLSLRIVLFLLCIFPYLILANIIIFLRPFNSRVRHAAKKIFCTLGLAIFGIKLNIKNHNKLLRHPSCIFISNHQHAIDVFLFGAISPPNTIFLAKESLFLIPFFGLGFWLSGNILINRSNKKKALSSMEKVNKAILSKQQSVWIMPEGTRSRGKDILLPFKKGAFVTAAKTGSPIVPICSAPYLGTFRWNKSPSATIAIDVLAPVIVKTENIKEIMDDTYQKMKHKIRELAQEAPS